MTTYNWILNKIINRNNGGGGSETPTTTDLCIAYAKTHDNQMFIVVDETENAVEPILYYTILTPLHKCVIDTSMFLYAGADSVSWEWRLGDQALFDDESTNYTMYDMYVPKADMNSIAASNQWPVLHILGWSMPK